MVPVTTLLLPKNLAPFASLSFDEAARQAGCEASLRETPSWMLLELRGGPRERIAGAAKAHEVAEAAAAERDGDTTGEKTGGGSPQRVSRMVPSESTCSKRPTEPLPAPPRSITGDANGRQPLTPPTVTVTKQVPGPGEVSTTPPRSASNSSTTLLLSMPSVSAAMRLLKNWDIPRRAGVQMEVEALTSADEGAVLRLNGTSVANAVACVLLQQAQWLERPTL
ncbi:PCBP3 [Symbiodinium pilosum]|uniref:PCBP3 protein n=1 Tax=Symbiodinium pilosum TaxID=2952 RepID=A0A812RLL7_SYMPI|nr:PCBP3 [Symbiodinium pilosum]